MIQDAPFGGPEAVELIAEVQAYYVEIYGGPDTTPVQADDFAPPTGTFVTARLDGELAGCAGLRRHDPETAELKRLYVRAAFRGRGLARDLMAVIEDRARTLGYRRLVLETGPRQPEAKALYLSLDYRLTENFGAHQDVSSTSFLKTL